jgi:hypothetical protein
MCADENSAKQRAQKSDLLHRLREMANDKNKGQYSIGDYWNVCDEAADEIERLRWRPRP